jgi:hypothetical protein
VERALLPAPFDVAVDFDSEGLNEKAAPPFVIFEGWEHQILEEEKLETTDQETTPSR